MRLEQLKIRLKFDRCVILESDEVEDKKILITFEDPSKIQEFEKVFLDESLVRLWMESSNSQEDFDPEKLRNFEVPTNRFWKGTRKLVLEVIEKMDIEAETFEMVSLASSLRKKGWWNNMGIF
ncbi:MAG: hypothetical protein LPK80_00570 [Bacteroidota bacterium]|nr:hypothetical protein [Bacteroidota bacterium]MDX5449049.1 hypothetical protein [Bacteroidota bacterium]